ncbi:MAG: type II toxin-antitoxin system VapC family toxin [Candidatus Brockarchaeota archaeon]|nr:type II toxin-antitoxin system VapC family toxin [Candidatus Brockarchaeota archaeon]
MGYEGWSLKSVSSAAVDTNVFIYAFMRHKVHGKKSLRLLESFEAGACKGFTTTVTICELAVKPMMSREEKLAREYKNKLLALPGLTVLDITPDLALEAARIRAKYPISLPDALQISAATTQKAQAFVTNDRSICRLKAVDGTRVMALGSMRP